MYKCKYCDHETDNKHSLGSHSKTKHSKLMDEQLGKYKRIKAWKECLRCKSLFFIERKIKGEIEIIEKKEKNFCSRKCANHRIIIKESKNKRCNKCSKNILVGKRSGEIVYCENCRKENKKDKQKLSIEIICKNCNKKAIVTGNKKTCSKICKIELQSTGGRKGGRISASRKIKRSKAEIYLYELCKNEFDNVAHNDPIFDGWDADIILHNHRLAILYNGKWHYEKITQKHSVAQVKNRDRIKIKKILEFGYRPYIIKDLGNFNKAKIEKEFEKIKRKLKVKAVVGSNPTS